MNTDSDDIIEPYAYAARIAFSDKFAGRVRRIDSLAVTHDRLCPHRHARRSDALRCAEHMIATAN